MRSNYYKHKHEILNLIIFTLLKIEYKGVMIIGHINKSQEWFEEKGFDVTSVQKVIHKMEEK